MSGKLTKSVPKLALSFWLGIGCYFGIPVASAATIVAVNFSQSGGPTQSGFTNWETPDNTATQLTTNISGIGLTFDPVVSNVSSNNGFRSLNRGGNDGYAGSMASLTQTWWGTRAVSGGGGQFVIIINGSDLSAGSFQWTSWHHDHENQTGTMDIEYSVNGGSSWTLAFNDFDIVDKTTNTNVGAPNPASFSFTANGTQDVHVRFTNSVAGAGTNNNFALINGFQIVPEPSAALLSCLGVLLLLRRRR